MDPADGPLKELFMELDTWQVSGRSFHFGRHGLGQEETGSWMTSDSLFAALSASLAASEGPDALAGWMRLFSNGTPALVLSSVFPRAGAVRFFPTPLRYGRTGAEGSIPAKTIKKIRFVSETIFRAVLSGTNLVELFDGGRLLQGGQVLISAGEVSSLPAGLKSPDAVIYKIDRRPRVAIARITSESNLYHTGQVTFSEGCGLWFAVRWLNPEPDQRTRFAQMLTILGDAGLGGERSSGFGGAEFQNTGALDLPDPSGGPWVTLSRYLPAADETGALLSENAAYALEAVGGWIQSPGMKSERRRSINMLVEGSVLGRLDKPVPGQLVDVQPDYAGTQPVGHPVWRSGFALGVGIRAV
jgi:CRISPR-associated protein Csm4